MERLKPRRTTLTTSVSNITFGLGALTSGDEGGGKREISKPLLRRKGGGGVEAVRPNVSSSASFVQLPALSDTTIENFSTQPE